MVLMGLVGRWGGLGAARRWLGLVGVFGCVVVGCLVGSASVLGARAHASGFPPSFSFGGSGVPGGLSLSAGGGGLAGSGVGVDGVSGDVFVADTGNHRVVEFSSAGVFIRMFGGEVDKTTKGDVCSASSGDTCGVGVSGSSAGEFEAPCFVAVDEASGGGGDVYVADRGDNLVSKFNANGELITGWGNNGLGESANGQLNGTLAHGLFGAPAGLAVDGTGNLWVYVGGTVSAGNDHMYELDRAGSTLEEFWEGGAHTGGYSPEGIGVNGSDDLYIVENGKVVQEYSASGGWLGSVAHPEGLVGGVAVDASQDGVYLDEAGGLVDYYSRECVASQASEKGCPATELFGAGHVTSGAGVAVDPVSGVVYVVDAGAGEIRVFVVSVEADVAAPTGVSSTKAQLNGLVNPEGIELSSCRFEYGEELPYTASVPCAETPAEVGNGTSLVAVHAVVSGLSGGETHYRLLARSANGVVHSEDEHFLASPLASIGEVASEEVQASSAVLTAKINPNGIANTAYHFEYDTTPYKAGEGPHGTQVPASDAAIATGSSDVTVSQAISGLTPDTTYFFRVVVSDADGVKTSHQATFIDITKPVSGTGGCPNEGVRGESNQNPVTHVPGSQGLPDCRAYEMVSPTMKNGALVGSIGLVGLNPAIAENGSGVITPSLQCFAGSLSCTGARQTSAQPFGFTRSSSGWSTEALAPPASEFSGDTVRASSATSNTVLFSAVDKTSGLEELFVREGDGSLHAYGPVSPNPGPNRGFLDGQLLETTSDLSHVVWAAPVGSSGWVFGGSEEGRLFEYAGFGNSKPQLVAVSGGAGSTDLIGACGESLGAKNGDGGASSDLLGSLSGDGSVVFFTVTPCGGGTGVNAGVPVPARELYARVGGSQSVLISTHATGATGGPSEECVEASCLGSVARDASFQGASGDGSRVFFTSTQQLSDSAVQDPRSKDTAEVAGCSEIAGGVGGCNLYMSACEGSCEDPAVRRLVDVSAGDSSGVGPRVQGVMAVSRDGSHVYFVAQGVLAGTNAAGLDAVSGRDNLYVYERDSTHPTGQLGFIATLPGGTETSEQQAEWTVGPRVANVTGDGGVLVFSSYGALTGDARPGAGSQIYRFDAASGVLGRVSIGAGGGFDDNGNAGGGAANIIGEDLINRVGAGRLDPSMSDDGSRVFFDSPKGLTPGALNEVPASGQGNVNAENVYEWEKDGVGSCREVQGCVYLISDGVNREEGTGLLGVDASGDNVFFSTVDALVGQDTDTELDYYDARVNGGFPAPVAARECGEGSCPGSGSSGSSFAAPGSGSGGEGNVPAGSGKPPPPTGGPHGRTVAQRLAVALKVCRKQHVRKRRVACERQARKRYPVKGRPKAKGKAKGKKAGLVGGLVRGVRVVGRGK